DATRKLVLRGADGVVFVADSQSSMRESNSESLENLKTNLLLNKLNPDKVALVLQYNKRDLPNVDSVEEMNAYLYPGNAPVIEASAINGTGVTATLRAAVVRIIENLKSNVDTTVYERAPAPPAMMRPPARPAEPQVEEEPFGAVAEARREVAFVQRQCGPMRGEVLDLACGMGRHMTILQEAGYRAVGCDLSFTLLRTGMAEYGPMPVARADMRSLPFCSGSFGGLVNFFTSFGYFATEEENVQVVREMARVLAPDAVFLFDYLNVDRELDRLVTKEDQGSGYIERWFDPSDSSC